MTVEPNSSFIAAYAMSLYIFNVSPTVRARALYNSFIERELPCGTLEDFDSWVDKPYWASHMPLPTAVLYMTHALARYGSEAEERVGQEMNLTDSNLFEE